MTEHTDTRPRTAGAVLRRHWPLIAVVTLVVIAAAAALTAAAVPRYRATTKLVLTGSTSSDSVAPDALSPVQRVKSYEELLAGPLVAAAVIDRLDLDASVEDVLPTIRARAVPDTVVLVVDVEHRNPGMARDIAVAVAQVFPELVQRRGADAGPLDRLAVFEPAVVPPAPVSPNVPLNLAVALAVGLLLGLLAAAWREAVTAAPATAFSTAPAVRRVAATDGVGTFTLSLDLELAWGSWASGRFPAEAFAGGADYARQLDAIARERQLPFTWAVVGALYDLTVEELAGHDPSAPVTALRPGLGPFDGPLPTVGQILAEPHCWLARDLVEELAASPAGHEIGTHTYFHATPTTPQGLAADTTTCRAGLPGGGGFGLRTIVYPRDQVRHARSLPDMGVLQYRGPGEPWYLQRAESPTATQRIGHTVAQAAGRRAPLASVRPGTATQFTSSAVLTLRHGIRRRIPAAALRRRFVDPLDQAVRSGGIYHLWTHPWNLAIPGSDAFDLLAEVCDRAATLRDRGDLEVLTMDEVCARVAAD